MPKDVRGEDAVEGPCDTRNGAGAGHGFEVLPHPAAHQGVDEGLEVLTWRLLSSALGIVLGRFCVAENTN